MKKSSGKSSIPGGVQVTPGTSHSAYLLVFEFEFTLIGSTGTASIKTKSLNKNAFYKLAINVQIPKLLKVNKIPVVAVVFVTGISAFTTL